MNIRNIFLSIVLFFPFTPIIIAQGFTSPDSSCVNSINYLKNNCYECSKSDSIIKCKVEEFGYLGNVNNRYYYYQITDEYDSTGVKFEDSEYNETNLTIFEGIDTKSKVSAIYQAGTELGVSYFYRPVLVNTKYGYILHINMTSGNGGWDLGEYYVFKKDKWEKLKVPSFLNVFSSLIPKSYWFCRGSSIDLKTMTIKYNVFKKHDACCCPTGGQVEAKLKVTSQNRIVIVKSKYSPDSN